MPLAVAICGYLVKVSETTINTPGAFFYVLSRADNDF